MIPSDLQGSYVDKMAMRVSDSPERVPQITHKPANHKVKVGDAVIVQTDNRNRGKWPLAVVQQISPGRDGYTHAV